MLQPAAGPNRRDDWAEENFVARVLDAEASLFEALCGQALEAHEARCDRICRQVMMRIAESEVPAAKD